MTTLQDLKRDYRAAFLRYLPRREEAPLHAGYVIGRSAIAEGLSILDLAQVHHDVFLEVLRDSPGVDLTKVATAASEFFVEVLAAYDMAQRTFLGDPGPV
jgi:Phosphoserine phosphatase RsbU, N-terminal domain